MDPSEGVEAMIDTTFVVVESHHLEQLRTVAKRLFTENRMTGDEMRDAAQAIMSCVENALPLNDGKEEKTR